MLPFFILFCALCRCGAALELHHFYRYLSKNSSTSTECEAQKNVFLEALLNQDAWALKMLDAFGRIPPQALTQGNNVDLGTYDQCVNILEKLTSGTIRGRYCFDGLITPLSDVASQPSQSKDWIRRRLQSMQMEPLNGREVVTSPTLLLTAACIPDACLPSDFFGDLGLDDYCHTKYENRSLHAGDIASLVFLGTVLLLILASTVYDLHLQKHPKDNKRYPIFLAFSAYSNGKKIFRSTQQAGQIQFFNGLKVISMFWVVFAHRFGYMGSFLINKSDVVEWQSKWYAVYVLAAPLAVDTFLFISGALLSYIFLKSMRRPNARFNILLFYLHRYLRLTPALAVVYFFHLTIFRKVVSGPFYTALMDQRNTPCKENWWSFFLYVQNYFETENMCLGYTWYLSADMQCFIVSPLILLPMVRYPKIAAYIALPILAVTSTAYMIPVFYYNDMQMFSADYMQKFYYVTHARLPPWLIGLSFGAFMLDYQNNKKRYTLNSRALYVSIWAVVVAVASFIIFYQLEVMTNYTTLKGVLFLPTQKTLWALCLCWICYTCLTESAYSLNYFLSLPIFQILSKVTYSTYLIHVPLLLMHFGAARTLFYFTDLEIIHAGLSDVLIGFFVGTMWTLAFESPMIVIEQALFGRRRNNNG